MHQDDVYPSDKPISLIDLLDLLKNKKWWIIFWGLAGAFLLGSFCLIRTQPFQAEATFLEKSSDSAGGNGMSGLVGMLTGAGAGTNTDNATALFKSKRLWIPIVQRYQLQASVQDTANSHSVLDVITNNLKIEQAYFQKQRTPIFSDNQPPLVLQDVFFSGEAPLQLIIHFQDDEHFSVEGPTHGMPIDGQLGHPWQGPLISITLHSGPTRPLSGRSFVLNFEPLTFVAESLANQLKISPGDVEDGSLHLKLNYPDRHFAALLLNSIMDQYVSYLQEEHENIAEAQLAYLERRRTDSFENLLKLISDYARDLSKELATSGILDSEAESVALQTQKAVLRKQLTALDLELKSLQHKDPNYEGYLDNLSASPSLPALIITTISKINELKQRRDRLSLTLRDKINAGNFQDGQISQQIAELGDLRRNIDQAAMLQSHLAEDRPLPPPNLVSAAASPSLQIWYGKVYDAHQANLAKLTPLHTNAEVTWTELKGHFLSYLNNFLRISKLQQRLMEERMALHHDPKDQFQGIDLESANGIYLKLVSNLNDTQAEVRQNKFIIDQVKDPAFEISSLSGTLYDPVSQATISQYSSLSMALRDTTIHSLKEQQRLKEEQAQQRSFLLYHLQQANQLLALRENFLEEKIIATLDSMLDLIQQQVSVSERHLEEYTQAHVEQLKQERLNTLQGLQEINQEMTFLPQKWVAEQMIRHQTKISGALVEEVNRLVESKNISHHLRTFQSGPLDVAIAPILPARPKLLIFVCLGACLGIGLSTAWTLFRELWDGVKVSEANLELTGQHLAGKLPLARHTSKFTPSKNASQLATLRRIAAHLCQLEPQIHWDKFIFLLLGTGVDYSDALATLLSKKGVKVLRLDLSFNKETTPNELPGLLQVLEGAAAQPKIISGPHFDSIAAGGSSLHGHELIHSRLFRILSEDLASKYDWIIVVKRVMPASAEAESLCHMFHRIAVTVSQEKLADLNVYTRLARSGRAYVTFIQA